MTNGIRGRIFTWLIIAIVPVLSVALVSTSIIESRLAERVGADMTNVRRLEVNRIEQELATYQAEVERLATATSSQMSLERDQAGSQTDSDAVLQQLVDTVRVSSLGNGLAVREAQVLGRDGEALGHSAGYQWAPASPDIVASVLGGAGVLFGDGYRTASGEHRVGIVAPVHDPQGNVLAAVMAEVDIASIVELLVDHHAFGETTEAYLIQAGQAGAVDYLSELRFTAVASSVGLSGNPQSPANQSLRSPNGTVFTGFDYRGVESAFAVQTIDHTGWGLAIRMDADEAFGISRSIRTLVMLGSLLAVAALLLGWALLLRPLVGRIRMTATAAERVANGDYTSRIDDRQRDEIGDVARGIDRLAADLEFDIRMRTDAEQRLRYQATHDELTNIFNRQHMTSMIRESLQSGADQSVSLLFLDLDDFKLVNDLWGHAVGDEVLAAVANRLRRLVGDDVLISRWGGDEFTVVLTNAEDHTLDSLAQRVRSLFTEAINTSVGPHPITCSVGVATAHSGDDLDHLLQQADARMFEEKQASRTSRMIEPDTARLVEMALADGRLEVHYQPIVSLQSPTSTRIEGVEALVRIRANNGTLRMPAEFLPEVLGHRYAREIDLRTAEMAMNDLRRWKQSGLISSNFFVALNLSPASMRDPGLAISMQRLVADTAVSPSAVVLELSEDADDLDPDVSEQLTAAGFRFAVDDFGVKRSNFDRVLASDVSIAKIDRRWLTDQVILSTMITACREKNVTLIGEGVETMEQLDLLYGLGVRFCQGFLLSKPLTDSGIIALLTPKK